MERRQRGVRRRTVAIARPSTRTATPRSPAVSAVCHRAVAARDTPSGTRRARSATQTIGSSFPGGATRGVSARGGAAAVGAGLTGAVVAGAAGTWTTCLVVVPPPHAARTLTTVTTVGYGDYTPETSGGRIIALVVMAIGIGFVALITAASSEPGPLSTILSDHFFPSIEGF